MSIKGTSQKDRLHNSQHCLRRIKITSCFIFHRENAEEFNEYFPKLFESKGKVGVKLTNDKVTCWRILFEYNIDYAMSYSDVCKNITF